MAGRRVGASKRTYRTMRRRRSTPYSRVARKVVMYDMQPQWLTAPAIVAPGAVGAYSGASGTVDVPVPRIAWGGKGAIAIEILRIQVICLGDINDYGYHVSIATRDQSQLGGAGATDAAIAACAVSTGNIVSIDVRGTDRESMVERDLTSAGRGFIVATDKMFIRLFSRAGAVAVNSPNLSLNVRFYYRFRTIGMGEYVGIVQSNQS